MPGPSHPLDAVTHENPYPYYATLVSQRPLHRDDVSGLWIAASAEAVLAVLESDRCHVRPVSEPVPTALLGLQAGNIFRHLVRMNEGTGHCALKQAVSSTLLLTDTNTAADRFQSCAAHLASMLGPELDNAGITAFLFRLPAYGVASLLGIPQRHWPDVADWTDALARGIAPGSRSNQIERGEAAACHLYDLLGHLLTHHSPQPSLLAILASETHRLGNTDRDIVIANGIGLLLQAYEATVGLIGNTLLALGRNRQVLEHVRDSPDHLQAVIQEVLRYDPPIHNTRRFVASNGMVAGHPMKADDPILVILAAANHDSAVYAMPERFDPYRQPHSCFTFGANRHACPGAGLAKRLAHAGVAQLLASGVNPGDLSRTVLYRPSLNARIPLFAQPNNDLKRSYP